MPEFVHTFGRGLAVLVCIILFMGILAGILWCAIHAPIVAGIIGFVALVWSLGAIIE